MQRDLEADRRLSIALKTDANVLLTGPTGSGKSHLAKVIHEGSARKGKPFVSVNLATLHEGTLESELFGHERGAYTGADQKRVGRMEMAQGGTVFLDEVGELRPRLQARLLEVLQSKVISPVGSSREIRLDVRIVAATHRNLVRSVREGEFREDLFHRLRVVSIELKPLRERPHEFDALVHSSLKEVAQRHGRSVLRISEAVAERLENYGWPGNLRELRNVLEYAVLASEGPEIALGDLPEWLAETEDPDAGSALNAPVLGVAEVPLGLDYQAALSHFEREYLQRALHRFRGRINQTARQIGVNKTTLIRRMRAYGLNRQVEHPPEVVTGEGSAR